MDKPDKPNTTIGGDARVDKESHKALRPLLIAALLTTLSVASALAVYKYYFETPPTNNYTQTVSVPIETSASTQSLDATSLVGALMLRVNGTIVPTVTDESASITTTKEGGYAAFSVTPTQPSGYDFYTMPKTMVGLTVATNDQSIAYDDLSAVRRYLVEQHFIAESVSHDDVSSIISESNFFGTKVHCHVAETMYNAETVYNYPGGKHQVQVGCADTSSYRASAEIIQPLYQAYVEAKPDMKIGGLLFGVPVIKSSSVSGYKRAQLSTGNVFTRTEGTVVLLYRTPDSKWHYFMNGQTLPGCNVYNTVDLKRAYAGEPCSLTSGQAATVTQ